VKGNTSKHCKTGLILPLSTLKRLIPRECHGDKRFSAQLLGLASRATMGMEGRIFKDDAQRKKFCRMVTGFISFVTQLFDNEYFEFIRIKTEDGEYRAKLPRRGKDEQPNYFLKLLPNLVSL
jgi:hypothetical protein